MNKTAITKFVEPYYAKKDAMHDLLHVRRLLAVTESLSKKHHADEEILTYAAYFHGIDQRRHEADLMRFMASQGLSRGKASRVLRAASDSYKQSKPKTVEGKILHDSHLVAGGRTLMVAKFLVTGALRGYSVTHTIRYFEKNVDGRFKCYLPETRKEYSRMEVFAREFFRDLKAGLNRPI